jgi:hypothetical protein
VTDGLELNKIKRLLSSVDQRDLNLPIPTSSILSNEDLFAICG